MLIEKALPHHVPKTFPASKVELPHQERDGVAPGVMLAVIEVAHRRGHPAHGVAENDGPRAAPIEDGSNVVTVDFGRKK